MTTLKPSVCPAYLEGLGKTVYLPGEPLNVSG